MTEREIVFWHIGDTEQLEHESLDEAVEAHLDACGERLPERVTVTGYARVKPSLGEGFSVEHALEALDEELGDPGVTDYTEPTPTMLEAERVFHAAVLAEYESWACEEVTTREVVVADWRKEHDDD